MTFPPGGSGLRSASERPSGKIRESWRSRAGTLAPGEERKRALQLRNVCLVSASSFGRTPANCPLPPRRQLESQPESPLGFPHFLVS